MILPQVAVSEETLNQLAGGWRIFQLRRGHRYSTDDVLTAWTAARVRPGSRSLLDLGAGCGSIGLLTLRHMDPSAQLTTIEVQAINIELQRKTVALNQLGGRVDIRHGDLRDEGLMGAEERFDLITANPPYLPPEAASASPNLHRATARLELHGNIFDFCRVAAAHLASDGVLCFCHAASDPRPEQAVEAAGLVLRARQDVIFREGAAPSIALFVTAWKGPRDDRPPLLIRDFERKWSPQYKTIRCWMGIDEAEGSSRAN